MLHSTSPEKPMKMTPTMEKRGVHQAERFQGSDPPRFSRVHTCSGNGKDEDLVYVIFVGPGQEERKKKFARTGLAIHLRVPDSGYVLHSQVQSAHMTTEPSVVRTAIVGLHVL